MTSKVLLYDRQAGEADVIGFDASGTMNLDWTNSGWRTSWDKIVAGNFVPGRTDPRDHRAPRHQVLLYDRTAGEADVVGFNSTGEMNLDTTNTGWRTSWDEIVVGHFVSTGIWGDVGVGGFHGDVRQQLLLYDRGAGEADVVGFDSTGKVNLDTTNSGWRTSWDQIVVGYFLGRERQQALLLDRSANQADIVRFDDSGHFIPETTDPFGSNSGGMVVGDFLGTGLDQVLRSALRIASADVFGWWPGPEGLMGLDVVVGPWRVNWDLLVTGNLLDNGLQQALLYDRMAGQAEIYGRNEQGNMYLLKSIDGWRTTWDAIVVGGFVGNGRQQLLLYDGTAGEADIVGFDAAGDVNLDRTNSGWRTSWNTLVAF